MSYINKKMPIITYTLLAIQVFVFILETVNGGSNNPITLIQYGAKTNIAISQNNQFWLFVTPMFVHIGFTHILINSLTLYFAGIQLEESLGHLKFFIIYFVSGIMGNLTSFAFGSENMISAGASTALFGLFATYGTLAYLNRSNTYMQLLGRQFTVLIVLNIVMDLFMSGIDIWGHIGGVIGGALITVILSKKLSENNNFMLRIGASLLLLILVIFLYSYGMGSKMI
ncbi:rhomboid family intramembrane serine protease [Companilactobacillus sp. DQM5]|uniref:rhomboid family intramembrane serine protease n=1 Tax=Companilactobacillus sp. DQM5 TaxID=3463359 RepID=UPI004059D759